MPSQELIQTVERSFAKTRRIFAVVGGGIVLLSLFMIWLGLSGSDPSAGAATNVGVVVLGVIFLVVGGLLTFVALRRNPVVQMLKADPSQIVWVYDQRVITPKGMVNNTRKNVFFCLRSGKRYAVVTSTSEADALYTAVQKELTSAAFGYSDERQAAFKSDPTSVR